MKQKLTTLVLIVIIIAAACFIYVNIQQIFSSNSSYNNNQAAPVCIADSTPQAPSNLFITAVTSNQINMSWTDRSTNEDGFIVETLGFAGEWRELQRVPVNVTSFQNVGLLPSTTYWYRVKAYNCLINTLGASPALSSVSSTTLAQTTTPPPPLATTAPVAPSDFKAVPSSNSVNLSWTDNSNNESGFLVSQSLDNKSWNKITQTNSNVVTFTNVGLATNTRYYYRISAVNAVGISSSLTINTKTLQTGQDAAPTISIRSPLGGITVTGDAIIFDVDARDDKGVAKVNLRVNNAANGVLVKSYDITQAPYRQLISLPVGSYKFSASVTDTAGQITNIDPPVTVIPSWIDANNIYHVRFAGVPSGYYDAMRTTNLFTVPVVWTKVGPTLQANAVDGTIPYEEPNSGATAYFKIVPSTPANQAPVISAFSVSPATGIVNTTSFSFSGSTSDPDGTIASNVWSFGDGVTSSSLSTSHTYTTANTYTISLKVTDNQGAYTERSTSIVVSPVATGSACPAAPSPQPASPGVFTAPAASAILAGKVNLCVFAVASAGNTLTKVDFFIQNNSSWSRVGESQSISAGTASKNVSVELDTTLWPNNPNRIMAMVFDGGGVQYIFLDITITNILSDPGTSQWFNEIGRSVLNGEIVGKAVKTDGLGNTIVAGEFKGSVDFKGSQDTSCSPQVGLIRKTALGAQDIFMEKFNPKGCLLWVKTFGGGYADNATAVALDGNNNILLTGYFVDTANFGGNNMRSFYGNQGSDIFVAKYSSDGAHIWSKQIGGSSGNNSSSGIAADSNNNVIVTGDFYDRADLGGGTDFTNPIYLVQAISRGRDVFVSKFTKDGVFVWAKPFGGTGSDYTKGVALDTLGNIVVAGSGYAGIDFGNGTTPNAGSSDFYVAKFGAIDGHNLWANVAGSAGPDTADGVTIDKDGNVFVTGGFNTANTDPASIRIGNTTITAPFSAGIYIAKYDSLGIFQTAKGMWYETVGGSIGVKAIAGDSSGNIVIMGNASDSINFGNGISNYGGNIYVTKFKPDLTNLWIKRSANQLGNGGNKGLAVTIDEHLSPTTNKPERNVLVTGSIQGERITFDELVQSTPGLLITSGFLYKVSP